MDEASASGLAVSPRRRATAPSAAGGTPSLRSASSSSTRGSQATPVATTGARCSPRWTGSGSRCPPPSFRRLPLPTPSRRQAQRRRRGRTMFRSRRFSPRAASCRRRPGLCRSGYRSTRCFRGSRRNGSRGSRRGSIPPSCGGARSKRYGVQRRRPARRFSPLAPAGPGPEPNERCRPSGWCAAETEADSAAWRVAGRSSVPTCSMGSSYLMPITPSRSSGSLHVLCVPGMLRRRPRLLSRRRPLRSEASVARLGRVSGCVCGCHMCNGAGWQALCRPTAQRFLRRGRRAR